MTPSHAVPIKGGRFLIVGGASLVGYHTTRELLKRGASEVLVFDNLAFGDPTGIADLAREGNVRLVKGDVMRLPDLIAAAQGMNGVLSLAALMSLAMSRDPWTGLDVNIRGVQNTLEAAAIAKAGKVVLASSNAVYGYGPGVSGQLVEPTPFHSRGAPAGAILYGASKIIGETLCRHYYESRGLDYVALRYTTVYGERQHYRAANALYIIETCDKLAKGERPVILGDGSDTKHFVYAGDLARANAMAFEANATDVAVNCSGPSPITTRALVALIAEIMGSELEPILEAPKAGVVRLSAGGPFEIAHGEALRVLGWKPEIDLKEGITRLLAWRKEQRV